MRTITISEFRRNIKIYVEIASFEKVIVTRGNEGAFAIIPLEVLEDKAIMPNL